MKEWQKWFAGFCVIAAVLLTVIHLTEKNNDPPTYQECNVTSLSNPNITWENVVIVGGFYSPEVVVFITTDNKRIYLSGPHFTERKVIPQR